MIQVAAHGPYGTYRPARGRERDGGTLYILTQPRSQGLSLPAPKSSWGRGERDPGNEVDFDP